MVYKIPGGSDWKEPVCNVGDLGLIPGFGRSLGGIHGNSLQYFACIILRTEELGRLQPMGSQRVGQD